MVKSGLTVAVVGLVVLFGYFYTVDRSELSRTDKAKQAALDVGDAVRDKGVAGLVQGRLLTKFGLDATRFLHAYYDEGRVVVYGLLPAEVDPQAVLSEAAEVPGVNQVELLVQPRPDYIAQLKPITTDKPEPPTEPTPETP